MQKEVLELDLSNTDFKALDKEIELLSAQDTLRLEIDQGLEQSLAELKDLEAQLPKEQGETLLKLCEERVMDTIISQFGLTYVLESKDGGLVTTTHNFKKGIVATDKDKASYEEFQMNLETHRTKLGYDIQKDEIRDESPQKVYSEYHDTFGKRGQDGMHLDHIVPVSEIKNDPEAHLFLNHKERLDIANDDKNLAWLDAKANISKSDENLMEWGAKIDKDTGKSNFEKYNINTQKAAQMDKEARALYQNKKFVNQLKKQGIELVQTGASQAVRAGLYSIFGIIMSKFVSQMMAEIKQILANEGEESLSEIFKRFKERIKYIIEDIKTSWKELFAGSLEAAFMAFLSNIASFVINTFATTLKKIHQVIMSGFNSLCQAVKILINPNIPSEDKMYEALKIIIAGAITALSLALTESINNFIIAMLGPLSFILKPIMEPLSITLSAIFGGLASTIVIYFMDKIRSQGKIAGLQVQMMAQSGVVVQYSLAKTWLSLSDAYEHEAKQQAKAIEHFNESKKRIQQSSQKADEEISKLSETMKKFEIKVSNKYKKGE